MYMSKNIFIYIYYGLKLHSVLALPELEKGIGEADIAIKSDKLPLPAETKGMLRYFRASSKHAFLFIEGVGTFLARNGNEIIMDPAPDADEKILRIIILGPLLGILLHQQGYLTLHACGIVLNGGVVVFLGNKGAGKSTLAAAFHERGHSIVTEEMVTFAKDDIKKLLPLPGIPKITLWPDAIETLGLNGEHFRTIHSQSSKLWRRFHEGFSSKPPQIKRIYVIEDAPILETEKLKGQEAFVELLKHSYSVRLIGKAGVTPAHFTQCAELAGCVPVYRLKRPRLHSFIPNLVSFLEKQNIPSKAG